MKHLKLIFSILILLVFITNAVGQDLADIPEPDQLSDVTYDHKTQKLDKSLPFDRYFRLHIKNFKQPLKSQVQIVRVRYRRQRRDAIFKQAPVKNSKNIDAKGTFPTEVEYAKIKTDLLKDYGAYIDSAKIDIKFKKHKKVSGSPLITHYYKAHFKIYDTLHVSGNGLENTDLEKALRDSVPNKAKFKDYFKLNSNPDKYIVRYTGGAYVSEFGVLKLRKLEQSKSGEYYVIVPPLEPNKYYEIILRQNFTDASLDKIYTLYSLVRENKSFEEQEKFYNTHISPLEEEVYRTSTSKFLPKYTKDGYFLRHYKTKIAPSLDALDLLQLDSMAPSFNLPQSQVVGELLRNEKISLDIYAKVALDWTQNQNGTFKDVLLGNRKIGKSVRANASTKVRPHRIKANLKNTISLLDSLQLQVEPLYISTNHTSLEDFYENKLTVLNKQVKENFKEIKTIDSITTKQIQSSFSYAELVSGSTTSVELKTRNAQVLVPDFGFTLGFANNNRGESQRIGRPHLGINYHVKGIDKNLPLSHITNKRIWNRLSIAVGVTIGKIDEGNYTDFFNGITPTAGLNLRLTPQIRIGTGLMIVREKDRNPLLDNEKIQLVPYGSLSFDFILFEQIGKLAGKIFN